MKQREILLISIPFSDFSSRKKRPVLVLSNNHYNEQTEDLLVAAITSNPIEKEFTVLIKANDLESGELKINSFVRVDKLYTVSKSIVLGTFGSVKPNILEQVKEKMNILISE